MNVLTRNNVTRLGVADGPPMLLVHGFGCDQNMWRGVLPYFEHTHRVVLIDLVGAGGSDLASFDPQRYGDLQGYADDVLDVCAELDLQGVHLVGHSVSAMIGVLAANREPERFASLVMVAPSPRYLNDDGYVGGFSEADIQDLLESLDSNYLGWSSAMAPVMMGNGDRPQLADELTNSFCRTDPAIASSFARVTFTSDNRADLPRLQLPTLVLQAADDVISPVSVGDYVHQQVAGSTLVRLAATGHCPHLSAPEETATAISAFLRDH